MSDTPRSKDEIELFGHLVDGLSCFGLGLLLGTTFARWFPDGHGWRSAVAVATLFAAGIWRIVLWRRRKPPSA